jgi:hypothetical protein
MWKEHSIVASTEKYVSYPLHVGIQTPPKFVQKVSAEFLGQIRPTTGHS